MSVQEAERELQNLNDQEAKRALLSLKQLLFRLAEVSPGEWRLHGNHYTSENDSFTSKLVLSKPFKTDLNFILGQSSISAGRVADTSCIEVFYNNTPEGMDWFGKVEKHFSHETIIKHSLQGTGWASGYDNRVTFQAILN